MQRAEVEFSCVLIVYGVSRGTDPPHDDGAVMNGAPEKDFMSGPHAIREEMCGVGGYHTSMPSRLKRYQHEGHYHFLTLAAIGGLLI
jgi:hypothetical protein